VDSFTHRGGEHLTLDSAKIYFEVHGDNAGPPLLFLHGGLGTMRDFNGVLPLLKKRFRLIGIDSRGHGKSTLGTAGLSYQRLALDATGVLRHLGVERCSVVGFSDGGITALRMAAEAGSRIDKLVAIGADKMLKPDDPVRKLLGSVTAESWAKKFPESVAPNRSTRSRRSRRWSRPSCQCGWMTATLATRVRASGASAAPCWRFAAMRTTWYRAPAYLSWWSRCRVRSC